MKIGIIGAGGHGGVVGDIAYELGYKEIYYFDDYLKKKISIFMVHSWEN